MRMFKAPRGVGVCVGAFVAMSVLLLMASGASAAPPKCLVVNVGANQSYSALQAAVNAAITGDTLKVKGTCYGDTTIGKNLTIVGQSNPGFGPATLNGGNNGSVVTVEGVTVAITDLTITGGESGIFDEGSVTLNYSTVTGNGGDGIYGFSPTRAAEITLGHSTVSGNGGEGIGGTAAAHFTVNDSTVSGNGRQGIGSSFGTQLVLNHSTVTRNRGVGVEGGFYGSITINNSIISGNAGGGIWVARATATLNYSTVSGNTAKYGGGIGGERSEVTLNNSTVSGNTGSESPFPGTGGGIYGDELFLTLNNSTVSGNTASGNGGGIAVGTAVVTLNGSSSVSRNTASGNGGGIYNEYSVTLNDSSSVSQNTASEHGGGIYNSDHAALNGSSSVSGNKATEGGGIYNATNPGCFYEGYCGANLNDSSSVSGNEATKGGGIYNVGPVWLNGESSVTKNKASVIGSGGGIYNLKSEGAKIIEEPGFIGTISENEPENIFNF
jgi:predicted outer membrane repeat protein